MRGLCSVAAGGREGLLRAQRAAAAAHGEHTGAGLHNLNMLRCHGMRLAAPYPSSPLAAVPHTLAASQVAVFDTTFHATMPPEAYTYALPTRLAAEHRIRRYGGSRLV